MNENTTIVAAEILGSLAASTGLPDIEQPAKLFSAPPLPVTDAESAALAAVADAGQILGAHALAVTAEQDAAIEAGAPPLSASESGLILSASGTSPAQAGEESATQELQRLRQYYEESQADAERVHAELKIAETQREAAGAALAESRRTVAAVTAQNHSLHSDNERLRLDVQGLMHQLAERNKSAEPATISLPGDALAGLACSDGDRLAALLLDSGYLLGLLHMPAGTVIKDAIYSAPGNPLVFVIDSPSLPQLEEGQTLPTVRAEYVQATPGSPPAVSFVPV